MSQLYQLFCEGLRGRSGGEGLSSTLLITSTPLDDEDDAGFCQPPQPPHAVEFQDLPAQKESQTSSVQGQVGSASNESPTEDKAKSPPVQVPSEIQSESPKVHGTPRVVCSSIKQPSAPLQEKNVNTSALDFVDKLIAVKLRDDALCNKHNNMQKPSLFHKPVGSINTSNRNLKRKSPESDSSETDFEGAEEYYKKYPASLPASPKQTEAKSPLRRKRNSSKGTSDESNMKLVMYSDSSCSSKSSQEEICVVDPAISSTSACEEDVSEEDLAIPATPSAARCRIYVKYKNKPKSPECQEHHENQYATENDRLQNIDYCGLPSNAVQLKEKSTSSNTVTMSDLLKGVVGYVEVRSGHDNRSMGVKAQLRALGATVMDKMTKQVTHVIFNEGAPSTLRRARHQGCHLVSVLWIDACKQQRNIATEKEYPPFNLHLYEEQPGSKKIKYRKLKSLQPDFDKRKSEERLNNYVKRFRRKALKALSSQHTDESSTEESSKEEEDETSIGDELPKQTAQVMPNQVQLKRLSVVLTRIDAPSTSDVSLASEKRNKRQLLPLGQQIPVSLSFEDFDLQERIRPEFPYSGASSSKSKSVFAKKRKDTPLSVKNIRRRSSCFAPKSQSCVQSQHAKKKGKNLMRTMVCTFMHRREIDVVAAVIKQLGGWILEPTVSSRTTHVVCGDSKRTINLLKGIANGCWILHQEWVLRSLEAGHWLNEESFELSMFPAIQQCRVARETLGVCSGIFSSSAALYVAKDTTPPRNDLLDLLKLCGANIVNSARQAKIIIGQCEKRTSQTNVVYVGETWVLDSIQENMLQPLRKYHL